VWSSVARYNLRNQGAKKEGDDGGPDEPGRAGRQGIHRGQAQGEVTLAQAKLRRKPRARTLLSFEEERRMRRAFGGVWRGRSTVELSRIVGSAGKHDWFDEAFMPLRAFSRERWKRIDRAFRLGHELPPVILYKLGDHYFVKDGNHRVSVARFHGAEWIDAEVTEFGIMGSGSGNGPIASPVPDSAWW
jgi:hypothetical protein